MTHGGERSGGGGGAARPQGATPETGRLGGQWRTADRRVPWRRRDGHVARAARAGRPHPGLGGAGGSARQDLGADLARLPLAALAGGDGGRAGRVSAARHPGVPAAKKGETRTLRQFVPLVGRALFPAPGPRNSPQPAILAEELHRALAEGVRVAAVTRARMARTRRRETTRHHARRRPSWPRPQHPGRGRRFPRHLCVGGDREPGRGGPSGAAGHRPACPLPPCHDDRDQKAQRDACRTSPEQSASPRLAGRGRVPRPGRELGLVPSNPGLGVRGPLALPGTWAASGHQPAMLISLRYQLEFVRILSVCQPVIMGRFGANLYTFSTSA
jgi:hypothetical protein